MGSNSIAYCTFPLVGPSGITQIPLEWYDHTTPTKCSMTNSLTHSISFPSFSTTRYVGYLYLLEAREYSFRAVFCTAIRVLIDYQQISRLHPPDFARYDRLYGQPRLFVEMRTQSRLKVRPRRSVALTGLCERIVFSLV